MGQTQAMSLSDLKQAVSLFFQLGGWTHHTMFNNTQLRSEDRP